MSAPDPYRPPEADLDGAAHLTPRPVRGVLLGLLVDWGGTIILSIVFGIVYAAILASRNVSESEIMTILETAGPTSVFGMLNLVMGTAMSFLGGRVCVRSGRSPSMKPPAVLAGLGVAAGLWLGGGALDIGMNLMLTLFSVSAVMIGAWLAAQDMRRG